MDRRLKTLYNMGKSLVESELTLRTAYTTIGSIIQLGGAPVVLLNEYNTTAGRFVEAVESFVQLVVQVTGVQPVGEFVGPPAFRVSGQSDGWARKDQISISHPLGPASSYGGAGPALGLGPLAIAGLVLLGTGGVAVTAKWWNEPAVQREKTKQADIKRLTKQMELLAGDTKFYVSLCLGQDPSPQKVNDCFATVTANMVKIKSGIPDGPTASSKKGWSFIEALGAVALGTLVVGGLFMGYRILRKDKFEAQDRYIDSVARRVRGRSLRPQLMPRQPSPIDVEYDEEAEAY